MDNTCNNCSKEIIELKAQVKQHAKDIANHKEKIRDMEEDRRIRDIYQGQIMQKLDNLEKKFDRREEEGHKKEIKVIDLIKTAIITAVVTGLVGMAVTKLF